jgi:lysozyme family protein
VSYTDNGDGTISDNVTGLLWERAPPATLYNWGASISRCKSLSLAGHSDWRLPTIIELFSIWDTGQSVQNQTTPFYYSGSSNYWSSSQNAGLPSFANAIYFDFGDGDSRDLDMTAVVGMARCVR